MQLWATDVVRTAWRRRLPQADRTPLPLARTAITQSGCDILSFAPPAFPAETVRSELSVVGETPRNDTRFSDHLLHCCCQDDRITHLLFRAASRRTFKPTFFSSLSELRLAAPSHGHQKKMFTTKKGKVGEKALYRRNGSVQQLERLTCLHWPGLRRSRTTRQRAGRATNRPKKPLGRASGCGKSLPTRP